MGKNVRKLKEGARETGRAVGKISKRAHRKAKQQSAAIIGVALLVVALLMPAGFGAVYDQLNEMGVNTVIASNSDENSTIYLGFESWYRDGTTKYTLDDILVDGYDYFLVGETDTSFASTESAYVGFNYIFNASEAENVDSIKVCFSSDDIDFEAINGSVTVKLYGGSGYAGTGLSFIKSYTWDDFEYDNDTNTVSCTVTITPDVLLKLADETTFSVRVEDLEGGLGTSEVAGATVQALCMVIDTKGVSSDGTKNIFLLCGGFLFGGLGVCMTPYVNPMRWINKKMGVR